jgi:hypothetical protein
VAQKDVLDARGKTMTRTAILNAVAENVGTPPDHAGPGMSALRTVLDNPSNDTVSQALAELAEEMTFLNRIYQQLHKFQGTTFESEAPKPTQ